MQIYYYKLNFRGPTHFGDTGIDLENVSERVTSDTLFSALVNCVCITDGVKAADDFVNEFKMNPPFLISSLFLYHNDKFFLPRPMTDANLQKDVKRKLGKKLKRLTWLTAQNFCKWISGTKLTEEHITLMGKDQDEDYKQSFRIDIRPRVSLDRTTQSSNIYHCGYVYFEKNAGLYGLVAFRDKQTPDFFKKTLQTLGEIGLGGEKTYGAGTFHVDEFQAADPSFGEIFSSPTEQHVLLSLYHPSAEEFSTIQTNAIAYRIVRRKGWVVSGKHALPVKRKSVGFFSEGSGLRNHELGCLVDVTTDGHCPNLPKHKVYRYGYAFIAPPGGSQ